jgi:hypothetical protein
LGNVRRSRGISREGTVVSGEIGKPVPSACGVAMVDSLTELTLQYLVTNRALLSASPPRKKRPARGIGCPFESKERRRKIGS